jgi:hypothetical protein
MKILFALTLLVLSINLNAAASKSYQVTGPIQEITDSSVIVQK